MVELIAPYIVCEKIGEIARSNGVRPQPFQVKAVALWLLFELAFAFAAGCMGMQGVLVYVAGFGGALASLPFSFNAVRAAVPKRTPEPDDTPVAQGDEP